MGLNIMGLNTPLVDCRSVATRRNGTGWLVECPVCGQWAQRLITLRGPRLICGRCWRQLVKVEHNGAEVERKWTVLSREEYSFGTIHKQTEVTRG